MTHAIEAIVCIPSFKRPEGLRETLQSLLTHEANIRFAVVVIDNDVSGQQALAVANGFFEKGLIGLSLVEPMQGNVHAINRAFMTAIGAYPEARYFLMVDDDEFVEPGWLDAMVAASKNFDAAIIGGPVRRVYSGPVSDAISEHPLLNSIESPSGPIDIIHGSGNCLIERPVFERLGFPYFDPAFNFLGGGDMDFFTRAKGAGFGFAWAGDAVVRERVGTERLSDRWIMTRSLRTGAINYGIDRKRRPGVLGWLLLALKNIASLLRGFGRFVLTLAKTGKLLAASHWLLMPVGRIMASFGWTTAPYKQT